MEFIGSISKMKSVLAVLLSFATASIILVYLEVRDSPGGTLGQGHSEVKGPSHRIYVTPRTKSFTNFRFTLSASVCENSSSPFLLVMVLSMAKRMGQRSAIRGTWGSVSSTGQWPKKTDSFKVKVIFLLGRSKNPRLEENMLKEAKIHQDIVQADFGESYQNLSLKVLSGFRWVQEFCQNTSFIMKIDEDVFVNIPYIMSLITKFHKKSNIILGPVCNGSAVERSGKYKVKDWQYYPSRYPNHVKGNMYVMSKYMAMKILYFSRYFSYVPIEDVFITGIVARPLGVHHVNIPNEIYHRHRPAPFCELVKGTKIMTQQYRPEMLRKLWRLMLNDTQCRSVRKHVKLQAAPVMLRKRHPLRHVSDAVVL